MPLEPFRAELDALTRLKITLPELQASFARTHPEIPGADQRQRLFDVLDLLDKQGVVRLPGPKRANWERVGRPILPNWVTLQRVKPERVDYRSVAWVPALSFAVDLRQQRQLATLEKINAFLIEHRDELEPVVPYRERALQIFGDEKYLDGAVRGGALYGRVPLSVIGACDPAPPLPREDFATRGALLLVENHHTYWTMLRWNENARLYRSIAYGAGNAIRKCASAVIAAARDSAATHLEYFGDLDPQGLAIPLDLNEEIRMQLQDEAEAARATSGPPGPVHAEPEFVLKPATTLYRLLLENGPARAFEHGKRTSISSRAWQWLPQDVAEATQSLFETGRWMPQEGVGSAALRARFIRQG
ncbi:MAG: DUF2220 family protein [Steroidobacteraceae bacterium]|nr:DUF2220 family protein [Steroidobacteraceae bacterium]